MAIWITFCLLQMTANTRKPHKTLNKECCHLVKTMCTLT